MIGTTRSVPERVDAQAFFVIDISRSMLASKGPGSPTRFDRAREIAIKLRDRIPQVPAGIASMTDRILPHAFPTTDRRVFVATMRGSVGIEQPPPVFTYNTQATWLGLIGQIPERHYFAKDATKRVLVVLTDGESRPFEPELQSGFATKPKIQTVFVHVWKPGEGIYESGVTEGAYKSNPESEEMIKRAASLTGGSAFDESDVQAAGDDLVKLAGSGKTQKRTIAGSRLVLMPYLTLAAFLPLSRSCSGAGIASLYGSYERLARIVALSVVLAGIVASAASGFAVNEFPPPPDGAVGLPYKYVFTPKDGAPPYAFFFKAGDLPPGLKIEEDGTFHGTPTQAGTFLFDVEATQYCGCASQRTFIVKIRDQLAITTSALPNAAVGAPYTATMSMTGNGGLGWAGSSSPERCLPG